MRYGLPSPEEALLWKREVNRGTSIFNTAGRADQSGEAPLTEPQQHIPGTELSAVTCSYPVSTGRVQGSASKAPALPQSTARCVTVPRRARCHVQSPRLAKPATLCPGTRLCPLQRRGALFDQVRVTARTFQRRKDLC